MTPSQMRPAANVKLDWSEGLAVVPLSTLLEESRSVNQLRHRPHLPTHTCLYPYHVARISSAVEQARGLGE